MRIIDRVLRQDFGFKHLFWVYSGRRGVHCWVSDKRARKMTSEARKAIVGFLEVCILLSRLLVAARLSRVGNLKLAK